MDDGQICTEALLTLIQYNIGNWLNFVTCEQGLSILLNNLHAECLMLSFASCFLFFFRLSYLTLPFRPSMHRLRRPLVLNVVTCDLPVESLCFWNDSSLIPCKSIYLTISIPLILGVFEIVPTMHLCGCQIQLVSSNNSVPHCTISDYPQSPQLPEPAILLGLACAV